MEQSGTEHKTIGDHTVRLAIDLDGVVANFHAGWIARYNQEFATTIPLDATTEWDDLHTLTHFPSMGEFWAWARGRDAPSVFRWLTTYDDAVPALEELARHHVIVIVTQKPRWAIHDTFAWLSDNRIPTTEVHITRDKASVVADVYLDDAPHHLLSIRDARPDAAVCRMVRPWNQPIPGVHDVESWPDFVSLVRSLDNAR